MSRKTLVICAVAIFGVVIISLVGNIITIGDKAAEIHPWVGWAFYILLGLFLLRFVVYPSLRLLFTPELKGDGRDKIGEMDSDALAHYIKRLSFMQEEKEIFATEQTPLDGVRKVLQHRDNEASKVVRRAALNVFIVTGISQNGSLDIITSFGMNLQMINRLVGLRHGRPTLTQLLELYVIVIASALIISITDDILDQIDTSEFLGSVAGGVAGSITKTLLNSSVNGAMNAYLTLRIGKLTMKYLELGSRNFKHNRKRIRKEARRNALKELPSVAKEGFNKITSSVKESAWDKVCNLNPLKKLME
ncbi:MAG: YcjF family protein [Alistipes sp.]|nr:YcjF family protein [Alistipes sp.]